MIRILNKKCLLKRLNFGNSIDIETTLEFIIKTIFFQAILKSLEKKNVILHRIIFLWLRATRRLAILRVRRVTEKQ